MPNFKWSEPESNLPYTYSNEFGELTLEPVTEFMPIKDISRDKLPIINDVLVSFDTAGKVVLITDNRRMSMAFGFRLLTEDKAGYAIKYSCCNRGAVCKITIKRFETPGNISAQAQIESMRPNIFGPIPLF